MVLATRCRWSVVCFAWVAVLLAGEQPEAAAKQPPIPGLDPGRPAQALPAIFVRESLAATRAALQAAYRLSLDARFSGALALTARFLGAPAPPPPAVAWQNGWQVTMGGATVGALAEWPDFDEMHASLLAWARSQLAAHPVPEDARPMLSAELLFDDEAIKAVRLGAKLHRLPAQRAHGIHDLSLGLVSLAFESQDAMQAADSLLAAAWAVTALDEALGHASDPQRALIAFALGYRGAAERIAGRLPPTSPVRAYLLSDNERLSALASDAQSALATRYLWLRRLLVDRRHAEAQRFEASRLAEAAATMPVVQAKVEWGDFEMGRSFAGKGPPTVVWSAFRDAGGARAEQAAKAGAATQGEASCYRRLGVDPARPLSAFDEALRAMPQDGDDVAGPALLAYYRAAMLTALREKGQDYLHTLGSNPAAAAFARSLADDKGATATTFKRWFDYLVAADAGQNVTGQLLENAQALGGIGGLGLSDVFRAIQGRIDWADPTTYTAARAVFTRLDSRPAGRKLAGDIAYRLPDLLLYERLYRSLVTAAPGGYPREQAFLAIYTGEPSMIGSVLALPQLDACGRIRLLDAQVERGEAEAGAALREMEAAAAGDKGNADGFGCLVDVLASKQKHADIVRVARAWLDRHPDPRGLDGVEVRRHLAAALRKLGQHKDALAAIAPAAASYQGAAMLEAARIFAVMGDGAHAQAMVEAMRARYPRPVNAIGAAEIAWRLGQPAQAAATIKQASLRVVDFPEVARTFARVFVDGKTPGLEIAAQEYLKAGLPFEARRNLIDALGWTDVKAAVALMEKLGDPRDRMHAAVRSLHLMRKVKGDAAAEAWGREQLRGAPLAYAAGAIADHREDALWLGPEPPPGGGLDLLWLFRAVAAQWESPSRHIAALKEHFAAPGADRYYRFGRLVMGLEDEAAGAAMRGTTPSQACEAAFYLGARAQGLGKLEEAHDWYRAALETSLPGENEYRFALAQLTLWSHPGISLARIAKEGRTASDARAARPVAPAGKARSRRK
jgi:hypothetical protein